MTLITSLDQLAAETPIDAIVNLAGEPIGDGLWTEAKRAKIIGSRVDVTGEVVKLIARLERKPEVLVSGSAIGWYGLWADQVLTESAKSHAGFSHELCAAWEKAARPAEELGVRVVYLRTGLVLGTKGGFRLIAYVMATPDLTGPVNATAPIPVTNAKFTEELGRCLHRPAVFRVPGGLLRRIGGGFADELLLGGQRVLPNKALSRGFVFRHETLRSAFEAIL